VAQSRDGTDITDNRVMPSTTDISDVGCMHTGLWSISLAGNFFLLFCQLGLHLGMTYHLYRVVVDMVSSSYTT